jgi:hypothetical protein
MGHSRHTWYCAAYWIVHDPVLRRQYYFDFWEESAYPWSTIQMVIIIAAINNPAPSHTIPSLGAVGDLD